LIALLLGDLKPCVVGLYAVLAFRYLRCCLATRVACCTRWRASYAIRPRSWLRLFFSVLRVALGPPLSLTCSCLGLFSFSLFRVDRPPSLLLCVWWGYCSCLPLLIQD